MKEPERMPVKIPKYIKDEHPFLAKKFKPQTRLVKDIPAYLQAKLKVKKEEKDDIDGLVEFDYFHFQKQTQMKSSM